MRMSMMSISNKPATRLTKAQIRSKIFAILRNQKEEERERKSDIIAVKLFRLDRIKKARVVMFYTTFDAEVITDRMIKKALMMGKTVVAPTCVAKQCKISPCKIGLNERLKRSSYGIWEPLKKIPVPLSKLDAVVIPGVAFDKQGNRLGRGKGYYDRFLKRLAPKTYRVGLAFDSQILPSIPLSDHDLAVDKVIFA